MEGVISGNKAVDSERKIPDTQTLAQLVKKWRKTDKKLVLVSGSWDLIHEGHALYLEKAKSYGDILIVGVDSDKKIRKRKGPGRPVVPEDERMRMLTHLRSVDVVILKDVDDPRWSLIKTVQPDILVATKETYHPKQIIELEGKYCGEVLVHERMATTSTSARLRLVQIDLADKLSQKLSQELPRMIDDVIAQAVEKKK